MIDPRALQQHFRKVQQKQEPIRASVPRVPDPKPVTAIEAIPVSEPIIEQEVLPVPAPNIPEPINVIINVPPPISNLVIEETEEEEPTEVEQLKKEPEPEEVLEQEEIKEKAEPITENPYGYSISSNREDDYDPYGYYSGPRF